ncbi:hypothetical protein MK628_001704 [Escherichia coli]|nr:hypothetical protein [Escherichia coli]
MESARGEILAGSTLRSALAPSPRQRAKMWRFCAVVQLAGGRASRGAGGDFVE